jgi:hypothetical protein
MFLSLCMFNTQSPLFGDLSNTTQDGFLRFRPGPSWETEILDQEFAPHFMSSDLSQTHHQPTSKNVSTTTKEVLKKKSFSYLGLRISLPGHNCAKALS